VRRYVVACLAGHGIGPEVMAEASRALARVSRLHGFRVEEVHAPFGGEAVTQSGHALPPATREATLAADAILVAAEHPALAGVESELDLHARIDRVLFGPRGGVDVVTPLAEAAGEWTLAHAFDLARSSRARVTSVGDDARWRLAFRREASRHDGVATEEVSPGDAVQGLTFEPERFDVVVAPSVYAEVLVSVAAPSRRPRVLASGRLARSGPSVFSPTHGPARDIAGQGVANPASMLLATSLMLGEGLGERRAAETLAGAVLAACLAGRRTPDMLDSGVGATTREFGDAVLAALPHALTTAEFSREVALA
jgi:3-isopropylmalate dehydrogenase